MEHEFQAHAKLYVARAGSDGKATFGHGLISLLRGVRDFGSLNRAAKNMHMAYSKAWKLMNNTEEQFGIRLIERNGARGSVLTEDALRIIAAFEKVSAELDDYAARRLDEELER